MADYIERQFFGTPQTVFDYAVDIAAGNFSGAGTIFDNTSDLIVPYATHAVVMIEMPDWSAAPTAASTVSLWAMMCAINGTADETDAPSGTTSGSAKCLGGWAIAAADALQRRETVISLEGIRKFIPYIKNNTAQNMNNDGGVNMIVKITPFAFGVTA
ncbi:hypothetical protein [Chromatium okenii]|uniref:hypothetical protein n=1 Tax=Chromatium okenii TaxID=61644 RepID=UPI0026EF1A1A|nr:hypothetical protein [Chromatium okenii]MBV5310830.1 hypothetical protein [Chromatium okenii]